MSPASDLFSRWFSESNHGNLLGCQDGGRSADRPPYARCGRSEEHTSELQSRLHLVCRLLLEKKNISHGFARLDWAVAFLHLLHRPHRRREDHVLRELARDPLREHQIADRDGEVVEALRDPSW